MFPKKWEITKEKMRQATIKRNKIDNPSKRQEVRLKQSIYMKGRFVGKKNARYINGDYMIDGYKMYRRKALKYYGAKCQMCGDTREIVLDVHHKDKNRENCNIENLIVLCKNCHVVEHVRLKGGLKTKTFICETCGKEFKGRGIRRYCCIECRGSKHIEFRERDKAGRFTSGSNRNRGVKKENNSKPSGTIHNPI